MPRRFDASTTATRLPSFCTQTGATGKQKTTGKFKAQKAKLKRQKEDESHAASRPPSFLTFAF
jgi:hypothetical protein